MRLFRRIVTWAILGIGLIILSQILWCVGTIIYAELQPSTTEQLLDFADLPLDTPLPLRDTNMADRIDYSNVEDVLRRRFLPGTSEQEIITFIETQDKHCDRDNHILTCTFEKYSLVCRDTIFLFFSFDAANRLEEIDIHGRNVCL